MMIRFETCDRKRALGFLAKFYPSYIVTDTDGCAGPILDLVEKDIIRIPDPEFHPGGQICLSKGFADSGLAEEEVVNALRVFDAGLVKKEAA